MYVYTPDKRIIPSNVVCITDRVMWHTDMVGVSRENPLTERDGRKASDALTASGVCGGKGVATATTND